MVIVDPCSTYTTKSNYSTLLDLVVFSPLVLFYGLIEITEAWNIWLDVYWKQRFGNLNHIVMFVYNEFLVNLQKYSLNEIFLKWGLLFMKPLCGLYHFSAILYVTQWWFAGFRNLFYCSVIRLFKRLKSLQYRGLFKGQIKH